MWQEKKNEVSRELGSDHDFFLAEKYRTTESMLSLLLTKAIIKTSQDFSDGHETKSMTILKNILKDIDESDWALIDKTSVVNTNVPFIKFLINLGMPESEIEEYHIAAKNEMDRYESSGNVYSYERCRDVFEFFEEMKEEEMQKQASEIYNNIEKTLRKISEEKMRQYEQQYN